MVPLENLAKYFKINTHEKLMKKMIFEWKYIHISENLGQKINFKKFLQFLTTKICLNIISDWAVLKYLYNF